MKKLVLLAVTAIVIAAVIFFGVKAIKATPKTADAGQTVVATATSVPAQATATPAPVVATPAPATATPTPAPTTTTPAPATEETASEATSSEATASEAPADPAEAFIESLCDEGTRANEIPSMARDEKKGWVKSVKLDDSALTVWTALDIPLGDDPEWAIPTKAGKPIVAGWAYQTRRVATVEDAVPDWYCTEHKAAKLSCETTSEDYTLYKGDVASESLRAFRLVRTDDGTTFEWRIALCECGTTEKVTGGGPGGSSPTKKPTTTKKPQAPAHEPEPTLPPKTEAEHEVAPTLPPKNDSASTANPNHSAPTLPPKQNGSNDVPSMGGDTW